MRILHPEIRRHASVSHHLQNLSLHHLKCPLQMVFGDYLYYFDQFSSNMWCRLFLTSDLICSWFVRFFKIFWKYKKVMWLPKWSKWYSIEPSDVNTSSFFCLRLSTHAYVCFWYIFGLIFKIFSVRRASSLKPMDHVMLLYKQQNMLD